MKARKRVIGISLLFLIFASSFIFIKYKSTEKKLSKLAINAVEIEEKLVKDTKFELLQVGKNNAKGKLEGTTYVDKIATFCPKTTESDSSVIKSKVKSRVDYTVEFTFKDGKWKVCSKQLNKVS